MPWSAIASGLISAASAAKANHDRQKFAKESAADANALSGQAAYDAYLRDIVKYSHRYRWTMTDMKSAGLNPILAASQGFNVASPSSTTPQQVHKADLPQLESYTSSAKDYTQAQKNEAETNRSKQEVKNLQEKAIETRMKVAKMRAEKKLITKQEAQTVMNINKIEAEIFEVYGRLKGIKAQTANRKKDTERLTLLIRQMRMEQKKLGDMTNAYGGQFGKVMGYIKAITEIFNLNLGMVKK